MKSFRIAVAVFGAQCKLLIWPLNGETHSMQHKFIINLAFVLFLNLLVKPFYILGIDTEVLNRVGEEVYGNYFALISFSFLMNIFLDAGITNFNTKNIAQHSQLLQKHFSNIIVVRMLLALAYLLLISVVGLVIGYSANQLLLLLVLGFNQMLVAFILYFRSNLSGLHLFVQDSIISVLDRVLLIGFIGILLWGNVTEKPFQIEWFVYGQTGAYGLTTIVAFLLVLRKASSFRLTWNVPFTYMILKQSAPYALLILLMSIYYRSDSVMLERMLPDGAYHAGVYAQGFRFFEAANMIAYLFAALLLPMFSRMLSRKEPIDDLLRLSFRILMAGALILGISCAFYAETILSLRYDVVSEHAVKSFAILMFCFIPHCSTYIFGTVLTANGSMRLLNILAGSGMVLNIVLNLFLIPHYFAFGSAVASLITQILTAGFQLLLVLYIFKLSVDWKLVRSVLLFTGGVLIIGWWTMGITGMKVYDFLLMCGVCVVWVFVSGMLSRQALVSLLRNRS